MDISTILVIAGTGLVVAAIIGGGFEVKEIKLPHMSIPKRILAAACGFVFLAAAYFINPQTDGETSISAPSLSIISPPEGSAISLNETIKGVVKPISPDGGVYRVMIMDDDGDHYPKAQLHPLPDGSWTHTLDIGDVWSGRTAEVSVVYTPEEVNGRLEAMAQDGSEALKPFPKGMRKLAIKQYKVK